VNKSRQGVLYEIDEGLAANRRRGTCSCGFKDEVYVKCDNCIIRDALMISRTCVILAIQRIDILNAKMAQGQNEIENKVKKLIKKEAV